jgi:hypothetical protein
MYQWRRRYNINPIIIFVVSRAHSPLHLFLSARFRYAWHLSSNYGDAFVENLAASKTAICARQGDSRADSPVAFFYGERVGDDCQSANSRNCFPHSYGGGVRIFDFLASEIAGGALRFLCPAKDLGMYESYSRL